MPRTKTPTAKRPVGAARSTRRVVTKHIRAAGTSDPTPGESAEREPRGARRKRETRARLLDAALTLMSVKGMTGVTINEITEAADVGFGSFYNHFPSKEAIYAALVEVVFEDFAKSLDHLTEHVRDPAEVVATCARQVLLRARRDVVWGHFLVREALEPGSSGRGLGAHMRRDIQRGMETGRFKSRDPLATMVAIGGVVLAALSAECRLAGAASGYTVTPEEVERYKEFPERVATMLLQILGLPPAQAASIARRPLPPMEPKP